GPIMKVFPPVRTEADQSALWNAIVEGAITSVGSYHAPHTISEQQSARGPQPAGVIGVETLGPLMVDAMVNGRISPERLAWVLSEGTARLYGIYPRKGSIRPGSDADLTLVDPRSEWVIDNKRLHSKHALS